MWRAPGGTHLAASVVFARVGDGESWSRCLIRISEPSAAHGYKGAKCRRWLPDNFQSLSHHISHSCQDIFALKAFAPICRYVQIRHRDSNAVADGESSHCIPTATQDRFNPYATHLPPSAPCSLKHQMVMHDNQHDASTLPLTVSDSAVPTGSRVKCVDDAGSSRMRIRRTVCKLFAVCIAGTVYDLEECQPRMPGQSSYPSVAPLLILLPRVRTTFPTSIVLLETQFDVKHQAENAASHVRSPNSCFSCIHVDVSDLRSLGRISIREYLVLLTVMIQISKAFIQECEEETYTTDL